MGNRFCSISFPTKRHGAQDPLPHSSTCSSPDPLGVNKDARYLLNLVWTPALEPRFFLRPRPLDSSKYSGDVNEHSKTGEKIGLYQVQLP
ncbi:hypothetical protein Q7C36_016431 [Tachysurus vachellii]|uniref:Uncharacterized protein n=1 Tax=Tachysurus vachellii TaxID=175792 RepID=A0AA88M5Y1_TACVA|nr:hypothetical protein Q7C36_016431 [Tachysurus vachellii]